MTDEQIIARVKRLELWAWGGNAPSRLPSLDHLTPAPSSEAPDQSPCDLGVGCEESGVCYALAHGKPEQCGTQAPTTPEPAGLDVVAYGKCAGTTVVSIRLIEDGLHTTPLVTLEAAQARIAKAERELAQHRESRDYVNGYNQGVSDNAARAEQAERERNEAQLAQLDLEQQLDVAKQGWRVETSRADEEKRRVEAAHRNFLSAWDAIPDGKHKWTRLQSWITYTLKPAAERARAALASNGEGR